MWSTKPAVLSFIIATPFWKTWWFEGALVLLVALVAYTVYRYRLRQALEVERLRTRISTDLHDDIGSTLSSISILSDMALHEPSPDQSSGMITEIRENSLSLMEKMDDIVWSINPKNDSMEDLLLRTKRFASALFEAKDIDYTITIQQNIQSVYLPMEYRQHIYLIMKEAINNLVKYSGATQALIDVGYTGSSLLVKIKDNGSGFSTDKKLSGNGILNMKNRAALMNASLRIESTPNEGTLVTLGVKIK